MSNSHNESKGREIKKPTDSATIMTQIVLPSHANALGTIFGGTVMSWIDIAAAIAAGRHARRTVVTASIDALHFLAPIRVGQVVTIRAMVNSVSKTSMEVGVRVDAEDTVTGDQVKNVKAYTTFVALDSNGKPTLVPDLKPESELEKRRYRDAQTRRESRIRLAQQIKDQC